MRRILFHLPLAAATLTTVTLTAAWPLAGNSATPAPFAAQATWPAGTWASPTFTPDGRTLVITSGSGASRHLMISHRQGGSWSVPEVAPFSGQWMDIEAAMAPDGSYLVFVSNRPQTPTGQPLDGFFGGQTRPGRGGNLWRVDRKGDVWGQPVHLPDTINASTSIFAPSVARNGDLFFMNVDQASGRFRLYRSRLVGGNYTSPESLAFSDGVNSDVDPVVGPDESFIIFSSSRPPTPKDIGQPGLFIAHRANGEWLSPQPLSPALYGVEARLAPDLRTLYFLTDRPTRDSPVPTPNTDSQKIWSVPFSPALRTPHSH